MHDKAADKLPADPLNQNQGADSNLRSRVVTKFHILTVIQHNSRKTTQSCLQSKTWAKILGGRPDMPKPASFNTCFTWPLQASLKGPEEKML